MSLLLQALKKAEAEKRRRAGLVIADEANSSAEQAPLPSIPAEEDSNAAHGLTLVDADEVHAAASETQAEISPNEVSDYPELNLLEDEPTSAASPLPDLVIELVAETPPESQAEANPIEFAIPDAAESWVDQSTTEPLITPPRAPDEAQVDSIVAPVVEPKIVAPIQVAEPPVTPIVAPAIPGESSDAPTVAAAQRQAQNFFTAPKAPAGRGILPWLVLGGAVLLAGMVAWFWWQYQQLIQPAAHPTTTVVTPVSPASSPSQMLVASSVTASGEYMDAEHVTNGSAKNTLDKKPLPNNNPPSITPSVDKKPAASSPAPIAAQYERNPAAQFIRQPANEGVNAALLAAWQSYQQGDLSAAERSYRQVLASDPRQRDALLGMAAIAQQNALPREAEAIYRRLLMLNPQDQAANAALLAMKSEQLSNKEATLLGQADASDPAVLGQFYASQQRWSEAQEQFFAAYTANPSVADNAFNLAVSLDHLAQSRLALTYYQRALQALRGATFDRDKAQQRVNELNAAQAEQAERVTKP